MPGGRPLKNGVDYFPLDVVMDDKIELIEAEHGIKGFGIIIKLLQKIYANNFFYIFDKKAIMVFSNRVNVDINLVYAVINSANEWGIFDKDLYKNYFALTSIGIQKRFFEITKRRKNIEVVKQLLLVNIDVSAHTNLVYVNIKKQRKGKERKGKELLLSDFETFWTLYDKKKDRKKCLSKFMKLKRSDFDIILKTLPAYIKSTPDIKYRKDPSTYLNNESWNDEIKTKNGDDGSWKI